MEQGAREAEPPPPLHRDPLQSSETDTPAVQPPAAAHTHTSTLTQAVHDVAARDHSPLMPAATAAAGALSSSDPTVGLFLWQPALADPLQPVSASSATTPLRTSPFSAHALFADERDAADARAIHLAASSSGAPIPSLSPASHQPFPLLSLQMPTAAPSSLPSHSSMAVSVSQRSSGRKRAASLVALEAQAQEALFGSDSDQGDRDSADDEDHSSAPEDDEMNASAPKQPLLPPAALSTPQQQARTRPSALAVAAQASSSARRAAAAAAAASDDDENDAMASDSDAESSDASSARSSPKPKPKRRKRQPRPSARAAAASAVSTDVSSSTTSQSRRLARVSDDDAAGASPSTAGLSTPSGSPFSSSPLTPSTSSGAPLDKFAEGASPMECGTVRRGVRILSEYIPFFGKEVELYTASIDPRRRVLVRASTLADKFCCATNKVGMYLSRRRHVSDGLYQATSFRFKPSGRTGLKAGGYFLSEDVCLAFEAHYSKHAEKGRAAAGAAGAAAEPDAKPANAGKSPKPRGGARRSGGGGSATPSASSVLSPGSSSSRPLTPGESKRRLAAAAGAGMPSWPPAAAPAGDNDEDERAESLGSPRAGDDAGSTAASSGRKRKSSGASAASGKKAAASSGTAASPSVSASSRRVSPQVKNSHPAPNPAQASMASPAASTSARRFVRPPPAAASSAAAAASAASAPRDEYDEDSAQTQVASGNKKRVKTSAQESPPPHPNPPPQVHAHPHSHLRSSPLLLHMQQPQQQHPGHMLSLPLSLPQLQVCGPRAMLPALDSPGQLSVLSSRPASSSTFHTDVTMVMRSHSGSVACPSSASNGTGFGGVQQQQQVSQSPYGQAGPFPSQPRSHTFLPHDLGSQHAHQVQLAPHQQAHSQQGSSAHLDELDTMFSRVKGSHPQQHTMAGQISILQQQQQLQQQMHSQALPPQQQLTLQSQHQQQPQHPQSHLGVRSSLSESYFSSNPNEQLMFLERRDAFLRDSVHQHQQQQNHQQQQQQQQYHHGMHGQQSALHSQQSTQMALDCQQQQQQQQQQQHRLLASSPTSTASGGGGGGAMRSSLTPMGGEANPLAALNLSRDAIAALQAKVQRALDELQELHGQATAAVVHAQAQAQVQAQAQSSPVGTVTTMTMQSHSQHSHVHGHGHGSGNGAANMMHSHPPQQQQSIHMEHDAFGNMHAQFPPPTSLSNGGGGGGGKRMHYSNGSVGVGVGSMPSIMHEELMGSSGFSPAAAAAAAAASHRSNNNNHGSTGSDLHTSLSSFMQQRQQQQQLQFGPSFTGGGDALTSATAAMNAHAHAPSTSDRDGDGTASGSGPAAVPSSYASFASFERDLPIM